MLAQRNAGWDVVDLHGLMNRELSERRRTEPGYFLARDGVHPGDEGHWLMAQAILAHLGARDVAETKDPAAMLSSHPNGREVLKLVQQKQRVLRDAWLHATGHKRPGMPKGLPIPEAEAKAAELDVTIRELARAKPSGGIH
jgi:hypothetical protein